MNRSRVRPFFALLMAAILYGLPAIPAEEKAEPGEPIAVLGELFRLEKATAEKLLLQHAENPDGKALRDWIDELIAAGKARVHECTYLRVNAGARAELESVEEVIYGSEGDPPEVPNEVKIRGDFKGNIPVAPSTFAAFATRNAGVSWVLEPTLETVRLKTEAQKNPSARDPEVYVVRPDPFRVEAPEEEKTEEMPRQIQLNGSLELVSLLFRDFTATGPNVPADNPLAAKWYPRFHTAWIVNELLLAPGEPSFVGTLDVAGDADQKLLVFFTAWQVE